MRNEAPSRNLPPPLPTPPPLPGQARNLPPPLPRQANSAARKNIPTGPSTSQTEQHGKIVHHSGEFPVAKYSDGEEDVHEDAEWLGSHELEDIQDGPPEIPKSIREQSILDAANKKFRQRANLNPYTRHTEAIKQSMLGGVFSKEMYAKVHGKVMAPMYEAMDRDPENITPFVQKQVGIAAQPPEALIEERMKGLKIDSRDPRLKELLPAIRAEMETLEKAQEAIKKARKREEELNQELDKKAKLRRSIRETGSRESNLDEIDSLNLINLMGSTSQPTRSKRNPEDTEKQSALEGKQKKAADIARAEKKILSTISRLEGEYKARYGAEIDLVSRGKESIGESFRAWRKDLDLQKGAKAFLKGFGGIFGKKETLEEVLKDATPAKETKEYYLDEYDRAQTELTQLKHRQQRNKEQDPDEWFIEE